MQLTEPGKAEVIKISEKVNVTLWDRWEYSASKQAKLKDLLGYLKDNFDVEAINVFNGAQIIYMQDLVKDKPQEKEKILMSSLKQLLGVDDEKYVDITVNCLKDN